MDAITASAALSAASHVASLLRGLVSSIKGLGKAEINDQVIDLQTAMMAMIEENYTLHEKIKELQSTQEIEDKIRAHCNAYWMPVDGGLDGPFLMDAWDREKKLVRLQCGNSFTSSGVDHLFFFTQEPSHQVNIPLDFVKQHSDKAEEFLSICGQQPIQIGPIATGKIQPR